MRDGQYVSAVRCFHAGQRLKDGSPTIQSESLSSSSSASDAAADSGQGAGGRGLETGGEGTRNASEGGASRSGERTCPSLASHMSRLRLPRYLRDVAHLETERLNAAGKRHSSPKRGRELSGRGGSEADAPSGRPPQGHSQRQMSLFNISISRSSFPMR